VLEGWFAAAGLPEDATGAVGFVVALTVVVFLHLVVGEMAPKSWAMGSPEPSAVLLARPLWWYTKVTSPLTLALNAMGNALVRLVGIEPQGELAAAHSSSDLLMLLRDDDASRELGVEARSMLTKGLELGELRAVDAMTPRRDVVHVGRDEPVARAAELMRTSGRSRLVVCGDGIDDVVGIVHVKDVLAMAPCERAAALVADMVRDVPVTHELHQLEELLAEMRASRTHLCVVVDEHGSVSGVVTLEDIVEELIGEFADESDAGRAQVHELGDGGFSVPGTLRPDELAELCGVAIPDGPYETVAGFVIATLDRIPEPGEHVELPTGTLVVSRRERLAVVELEVHPHQR